MKLYVCWGLFKTPKPGHPCRNAHDALVAAGHDPQVIRTRGWGLLPAWLNRTEGRREVRQLSGDSWVPLLLTESGEPVKGSKAIVSWAAAHPADPPRTPR